MKKIISGKRIIFTVMFLAISAGLFLISFSFTGGRDSSPQSGGWQLQTSMQALLNGKAISDMVFLDSLTGFAVSGINNITDTGYIFKTTNSGTNWFVSYYNTIPYSNIYKRIIFVNDSVGYACGSGGEAFMCKTTNRGNSWIKTIYSWATGFRGMSILGKDSVYVVDDNALVGGVFRSIDGGGNWQRIYNGAQYNPQYIYMINGMIGYYSQGDMYKTTNGGFSWTLTDNAGFRYMKFFDTLNGYRITSSNERIQKTSNGGFNWTTFTLPNVPGIITSGYPLQLSFLGTDTIYVSGRSIWNPNPGSYRGIIVRTTNGGINWGYQIPDTSYDMLGFEFINFFNAKNGWAYWSIGRGIHTTTGGDSTILLGINQTWHTIPEQFSLEQNYPNPFNQSTIINLQTSIAGFIKLTIYDITGKEIATLMNEKKAVGSYSVRFDAGNLSSGIYFYQLSINNERLTTKRMSLIK